MKITKEDIEDSIHEYNKAIKKLEDAGIDYDNYTVTISHARWIKLLTILKTHIEAWEKVSAEIENDWQFKKYPRSPGSCGLRRALEIIDKYRGDTDGNG